MSNGNTTKILGGVAIFLILIAAGFFAFTQYEQHAYIKQAVYAEEVASDARDVALECQGLSGNPESDAARDFLDQLNVVQGNLKKATDALKSARPGSKYRTANADLVEALILEENILEDVQRVRQGYECDNCARQAECHRAQGPRHEARHRQDRLCLGT